MKAAIVSIGDELLIGQTVNTNASFISEQLTLIGVAVQKVLTISDDEQEIKDALSHCQNKFEIVIITGGLGPTKDDITKKTIASHFNKKLVLNELVLEKVESFFKAFNRDIQDVNRLQALVPEDCEVLMNAVGTAPGMWIHEKNTVFVSLPGVPREMRYLITEEVVPKIKATFQLPAIYSYNILTQGIGESYIAEEIADLEDALPSNIKLAYLPSRGLVKLRLTGRGSQSEILKTQVDKYAKKISTRIAEHVFGKNEDDLAQVVGELLIERGKTVCSAESLTGGSIAAELVKVSGASKYYQGGIVAYQNEVKTQELNVNPSLIEKYGVVSAEVVEAMALGALNKFKTDYSIATTGIAGPDGGTEDCPVGTVYIGVGYNNKVFIKSFSFGSIRSDVIRRTVLSAINLLRSVMLEQ